MSLASSLCQHIPFKTITLTEVSITLLGDSHCLAMVKGSTCRVHCESVAYAMMVVL